MLYICIIYVVIVYCIMLAVNKEYRNSSAFWESFFTFLQSYEEIDTTHLSVKATQNMKLEPSAGYLSLELRLEAG